MPYWVEQTKGPHVDAIKKIVADYKATKIGMHQAWDRLSELYEKMPYHMGAPSIENRDNVHYMLVTWFPLYANLWGSDGTCTEMYLLMHRLERQYPGTKFRVGYEY